MKKTTRITLLLWMAVTLLATKVKAQNDSLIYTSHDTSVYHTTEEWRSDDYSRLFWDLTKDGTPDITFYFTYNRYTDRIDIDAAPMYETYSMGFPDKLWMIYDFDSPLDCEEAVWIVNILGPNFGDYPGNDTTAYRTVAFRREQESAFYYGWFILKADWIGDGMTFSIPESAFCTIPNYPLRWGQTSLTEGIEENAPTAFVSVHPNPTTDQINITGMNLNQAEVLNTLGQRVATATGKGETLHIDISHLPAGVYFVNVSDSEGRKFVRKVVKE